MTARRSQRKGFPAQSNFLDDAVRMEIERREFVRQRVSRVEVRVASQEAFRASYLRDLSLGGLFVRSRQPLPEGTAVVVELLVEARPAVRLRGEVMRQEHAPDGTPRGFGVRFSMVDAETKQALEQILAAHQPPAQSPPADLETQLAEARGTIEAYEESLALLRENEASALQKLEASEAECGLLVRLSHELQARVQALEARDDSRLRNELQELAAQLDDERLKSMALERALQRFVDMGGVVLKRTE